MTVDRVLAAVMACTLAVAAGACTGGGGDGPGPGPGAGGSLGDLPEPSDVVQHQFHSPLGNGFLTQFGLVVPDRFEVDLSSTRVVDLTLGEVEFQTQKELSEFAVERGMLGFYAADAVASEGEEFWGVTAQVFRDGTGPLAVFDQFGNPERVSIDDARLVDTRESALGGGRAGVIVVDRFQDARGATTVAVRGSMVDDNVLIHVSAIVDVDPGTSFDGAAEMRRVLDELAGFHATMFEEFLDAGGTDEPPEDDGGDGDGGD